MIPARFERFIDRLQRKTNSGRVKWVDAGRYMSFRCELGRFEVRIERGRDDAFEVGISDGRDDGEEIDGFCVEESYQDGWNKLEVIHSQARRQAYDVDKVIEELSCELEAL